MDVELEIFDIRLMNFKNTALRKEARLIEITSRMVVIKYWV